MTRIEWTDEGWNPVIGCTRVSAGCDNCYMFAGFPRLRKMKVRGYDGEPDDVRLMPERLDTPYRWRRPRRVFVNSMSDLFHTRVPFDYITKVFTTMRETPNHTYQVLTKRPGRIPAWWERNRDALGGAWPANVWIGTSVENQRYVARLDVLERVPAPIRFVSAEPLLGPLDLSEYLRRGAVQWVIVGGESGRNARPMELSWAREIRDQCEEQGVPFFLKQLGGTPDKRGGAKAVLEEGGPLYHEYPMG